MREFILKLLKYSLLALLLINVVAFVSLFCLRKSEFYKPSYLINHFEENTQFDYIVLGSSRGLTTINTKQIDKNIGSRGVNLSIDDTGLPTHRLMLEHFYTNNFKTKKVILTLDRGSFKKGEIKINDNDYRFLPFISNDYVHDYCLKYEKGIIKKLSYSKYFPFLGLSFYNAELFFPSIITIFDRKRRNRFDDYGNYQYPAGSKLNSNNKLVTDEAEISNPMVMDLKRLCEENNSELILYIAPIYKTKLIIKNDIGIKIINHVDIVESSDNFYDHIHVNQEGREITTKAVIDFIK